MPFLNLHTLYDKHHIFITSNNFYYILHNLSLLLKNIFVVKMKTIYYVNRISYLERSIFSLQLAYSMFFISISSRYMLQSQVIYQDTRYNIK